MQEPRRFPVQPDLSTIELEAENLLNELSRNDPHALEFLKQFDPDFPPTEEAYSISKLRETVARSYGFNDWERLKMACELCDTINRNEIQSTLNLIKKRPHLLRENANGSHNSNWGPPMSHAATLGYVDLVAALLEQGAPDATWALTRSLISDHFDIAELLLNHGAQADPNISMVLAEIQNGPALSFLMRHGFSLASTHRQRLDLVALVLETYSRYPAGKHVCFQLFETMGVPIPDTPPFAVHRGRIDLLERLIQRNSDELTRCYLHEEIYPQTLGCHEDATLALCGTPISDATLLHLCVDYDEFDMAKWLLQRGFPVDTPASIDSHGFGGHTALFNCVVSQPFAVGRRTDSSFADLLLQYGANVDHRASIRKRLRFAQDESVHEYQDVTPFDWGQQFHDQSFVNTEVIKRLKRN